MNAPKTPSPRSTSGGKSASHGNAPAAPVADTHRQPTNTKPVLTELPVDRMPTLRVMPMPCDANSHGDVFGGWIMSQVDIAGSIPCAVRAGGRVVTIAVESFIFKQPVFVGDVLSFYVDIVKTGRTSITVFVEVYSQRQRMDREVVKVTEAYLTYVATDEARHPRPLPPA